MQSSGGGNDLVTTMIRNTLMAIRQQYPELADAMAQQMGSSVMSGMGDAGTDWATVLQNIATTAANLYTSKTQASSAATAATAAAQAEVLKQQAALAQQQAAATSAAQQAAIRTQQLQLQQYQAQLQAGTTKTLLLGGAAVILGFVFLSLQKKKRGRR